MRGWEADPFCRSRSKKKHDLDGQICIQRKGKTEQLPKQTSNLWSFLVPLVGGRYQYTPPIGSIYHYWVIICHLPPIKGIRNSYWAKLCKEKAMFVGSQNEFYLFEADVILQVETHKLIEELKKPWLFEYTRIVFFNLTYSLMSLSYPDTQCMVYWPTFAP